MTRTTDLRFLPGDRVRLLGLNGFVYGSVLYVTFNNEVNVLFERDGLKKMFSQSAKDLVRVKEYKVDVCLVQLPDGTVLCEASFPGNHPSGHPVLDKKQIVLSTVIDPPPAEPEKAPSEEPVSDPYKKAEESEDVEPTTGTVDAGKGMVDALLNTDNSYPDRNCLVSRIYRGQG